MWNFIEWRLPNTDAHTTIGKCVHEKLQMNQSISKCIWKERKHYSMRTWMENRLKNQTADPIHSMNISTSNSSEFVHKFHEITWIHASMVYEVWIKINYDLQCKNNEIRTTYKLHNSYVMCADMCLRAFNERSTSITYFDIPYVQNKFIAGAAHLHSPFNFFLVRFAAIFVQFGNKHRGRWRRRW